MIKNSTFIDSSQYLLKLTKIELKKEKKQLLFYTNALKVKTQELKSAKGEMIAYQSTKPPFFSKVPVLGASAKQKHEMLGIEIMQKGHSIKADVSKNMKAAEKQKKRIINLTGAIKKYITTVHDIDSVFSSLKKEHHVKLMMFVNKIEFLKQSRNKKFTLKDFSEISKIILPLLEGFSYTDKENIKPETSTESQYNVYLPIPLDLRHQAKRLGARYDADAGRGSRMFINLKEDQKVIPHIQHMLPLAFRQKTEAFEFPPIRHNAAKQNLWSLFSKDTWDFVRGVNYAKHGNRCAICGKQGGHLIDKIMPEEQNKKKAVESHEIWEWHVPDPSTGVGIQKLKEIMTLCVDCHMMFHEGYAVSQAKIHSNPEEVKDFIRQKQMLVNRVDEATLEAQIESDKSRAELHNGVDKWVIDLSNLASQDYMKSHLPVFLEDNMASVDASMIAGIDFETDHGNSYEAEDAITIYNRISSELDRELEETSQIFQSSDTSSNSTF